MPSGISTMPCNSSHNNKRENSRYRHLERPHNSISNTRGVSTSKLYRFLFFVPAYFIYIYSLYTFIHLYIYFRHTLQWSFATTNFNNSLDTISYTVTISIMNNQTDQKNPTPTVQEVRKPQPPVTMARKWLQ